ncbi:MAG: cyclic nucleotide-binding domain-containing protein [Hydrogenophilaceae bacterium]|nr:cyclic nucleotide-binding domain-containing protein [Hydrogenophilaceae bacterium]
MDEQTLEYLDQFVPISSLSQQSMDELGKRIEILHFYPGQTLFNKGDNDKWLYYLLEGQVSLVDEGRAPIVIDAGSEDGRYALARLKPRRYTGVAKTPTQVLRVDEETLDRFVTMDQATGFEVTEFEGEDPEWMFTVLTLPAFQKLPPANTNAMFGRFERVEFKAGDVVIRQGDPGDNYYLIREGEAEVTRAGADGKPAVLAKLGKGDGFGEEALISGMPRNATVTMLSSGVLMRMAQQDFNELLKAPMVKWVTPEQVRQMLTTGAVLIDVRLEDEFKGGTLKGAINIPLAHLRARADKLDPKQKYIVFCQSGQRSAAAAFLLEQRGFNVHVLKGGLDSVKG